MTEFAIFGFLVVMIAVMLFLPRVAMVILVAMVLKHLYPWLIVEDNHFGVNMLYAGGIILGISLGLILDIKFDIKNYRLNKGSSN